MNSTDDDDLFATLGGSLMKDLLADLNDDADASFLSLEQLEKELAHLESKPSHGSMLATVTEEMPSAASLVVQAAQQQQTQQQGSLYGDAVLGATDGAAMDAWSLSLQKFTAASLEEDFLQADSARKALQPAAPPGMSASNASAAAAPPGLEQLLSKAEEYDVQERLLVRPPPGMGSTTTTPASSTPSIPEQAAKKLQAVSRQGTDDDDKDDTEPAVTAPHPFPATPQNSMVLESSTTTTTPTPTPTAATAMASAAGAPPSVPALAETPVRPPPAPPVVMTSPQPVAPPPTPAGMPPNSMYATPQGPNHPPSSMMMPMMMPPALTAVPVAVPLPPTQPPRAWQNPPMPPPPAMMHPPPPPPPKPVYANPHPDAPPVPANSLATPFMTVRDISYVVHSILKPVLALGTSPFDYDQVYWRRRGQGLRPGGGGGKTPNSNKKMENELQSRQEKAQEWSASHATLGKTAKGNVARPRALIAQPVVTDGTAAGGEERQRQTLWKARIYCDQAYQAYMQVVELWERSPGTAIPAKLQPHLVKLLRCLGITVKDDAGDDDDDDKKPVYTVDPAALTLLLKLPKGRVLLARLLEQALLPPASVQVLLPHALNVLYTTTTSSSSSLTHVDDRVFAAWARVVNSLPDLTTTCVTEATQVVLAHPTQALQSTSRMQTVHALLRRGSLLAAEHPSDFAKEWSTTETNFLQILGGAS